MLQSSSCLTGVVTQLPGDRAESPPPGFVSAWDFVTPPPETPPESPSRATGVHWPDRLPPSRTRKLWFGRLSKLPPGLGLDAIARRYRTSYRSVYHWVSLFGYPFIDRRCRGGPAQKWDAVDWQLSDSQIARQIGVSRERVRQIRFQRGLPPSPMRQRTNL